MKAALATLLLSTSVKGFAPLAPPTLTNLPPTSVTRLSVLDPSGLTNGLDFGLSQQDADLFALSIPHLDPLVTTDQKWLEIITSPFLSVLTFMHEQWVSAGVDHDAWGMSLISMTILIKLMTFPLTKSQLIAAYKMQALQPKVEAIQAKYQSKPDVMNQKIAMLYASSNTGCIPTFYPAPLYVGLFYAILTLANDNVLNEQFLFLPNLAGPTYGSDLAHGSNWLLQNWFAGEPLLAVEDTAAFLTIPLLLIIGESISMQLQLLPRVSDQQQKQESDIRQALPFLAGWFALSVPAAVGVCLIVNNIITTSIILYIRGTVSLTMEDEAPSEIISPGAFDSLRFSEAFEDGKSLEIKAMENWFGV